MVLYAKLLHHFRRSLSAQTMNETNEIRVLAKRKKMKTILFGVNEGLKASKMLV